MKTSHAIMIVAASVGITLAVQSLVPSLRQAPTSSEHLAKETAFKRVLRTGTLRCGYIVLPPEMIRDPNTGGFSGISYDITMEAAKRLGLKVDWTEEVNFAIMAEGLKTGRYDSICFTGYRWLPSAMAMEYSVPIFYSTTSAYVRADDHRFDASLADINNPAVTVATIDGEASTAIKAADFPDAKAFSMSQNTDLSQAFQSVATNKADVAFANPIMAMDYMTANPSTLRKIEMKKPIRIYAHSIAFEKGEHDLLTTFNLAIEEMASDGFIDATLDKYEKIPYSFVRIPSISLP